MQVFAVVQTDPGVLELNYSWLPTWIGMNAALKKEIETALTDVMVGKTLDDHGMVDAHRAVIQFLCDRFPGIQGLRDHLDSLKFITIP